MVDQFVLRFKAWRSNTDKSLHIIAMEEQFETLPQIIRRLGPWAGSYEGEVTELS